MRPGGRNNGAVRDDPGQDPCGIRVRLFGEVDVEGAPLDPTVKLRPLSRGLLARLALAEPGERLDTEELARLLVVKVAPGVPVAPDKLSSAQQQLRNAQWELRKRLGEGTGGARLLGAGRRWVALEGARSDHREFLDAAEGGDVERARAIASRGEFLAGIDDPWTAPHRHAVQERLRALGPPAEGESADGREGPTEVLASASGEGGLEHAPATPAGRSHPRRLVALAALVVAVGAVGLFALTRGGATIPDAAEAPPDVTPGGEPVVLAKKPPGRCQELLPGSAPPTVTAVRATGRKLGEVRTYYQPEQQRTCAKLVKPQGTPLHGEPTHLALTLCGDENQCGRDWHVYEIDAGPVVVPSRDGCVSWRVSMADKAGGWPVLDRVGWTGCSD